MRKLKKIVALTCATTMLLSSVSATAFAADLSDVTSGGSGVVENNNSSLPKVTNMVVPAASTDVYDFTIDADGLLATYGGATYVSGKSVYFDAVKTAAKLNITLDAANTTYKLVKKANVEDTGLTAITASFASAAAIGDVSDLANYSVWVPDTDNAGEGKFVTLTTTNYTDYLVVDFTAHTVALVATPLSGDNVFSNKVYKNTYVEVTAEDAVEYYIPAADPTPASLTAGLYVETTPDAGVATYATAALGTNVQYVAETRNYTDISDVSKVVNKSTFDVAVKVAVEVKDAAGLNFVEQAALSTTTDKTGMYMAVTDGTSTAKATVGTDATTAAYYVLKGTGATAITYQTDDTDPETGSHVYKQYLEPNLTGEDVEFAITAAINKTAGDAWDAYVKGLEEGTYTKPSVEVVYSFTEVTVDKSDNTKYVAADNSVYTVATAGTDMWATYAAGTPAQTVVTSGSTVSMTYSGTGAFTWDYLDKDTYGPSDIAIALGSGATASFNGTKYAINSIVTDNVTLDTANKQITFSETLMGYIKTDGATVYLIYGDGSEGVLTIPAQN